VTLIVILNAKVARSKSRRFSNRSVHDVNASVAFERTSIVIGDERTQVPCSLFFLCACAAGASKAKLISSFYGIYLRQKKKK
jgi:hypothetical protein